MSHPLIVEAAESLFVPVIVHNNKQGIDATILKKFREPSWNNPVVRFIDKDGRDIIKRKAGIYSASGLASRMIASLKAANRDIPAFLKTVSRSWASNLHHAIFAMSCLN